MSFFTGYIKIRQTAALMKLDLSMNLQKHLRISEVNLSKGSKGLKEISSQ